MKVWENESMNYEESENSTTYIKSNIGVVNFYSLWMWIVSLKVLKSSFLSKKKGIKVSLKTGAGLDNAFK